MQVCVIKPTSVDDAKEITDTIQNVKNNTLELDIDQRIGLLKDDFSNIAMNALDKAANYVIKAMPIPDAMKDILKDVKDAMKTKEIKQKLTKEEQILDLREQMKQAVREERYEDAAKIKKQITKLENANE